MSVAARVVFGALLLWACRCDWRTRRIPNAVVAVVAALGVLHAFLVASPAPASWRVFGGLAVGLVVWLPFYAMRMLGAGDVKFFAAASSWLGPAPALRAAILAALFGGVLAVIWMMGGRRKVAGLPEEGTAPESRSIRAAGVVDFRHRLPYGLAMAAGLAVVAWRERLLW